MTTAFKMLWKHKDFPEYSEGPILRHSRTGSTKTGPYYTKRFAEKICRKFNENRGKLVKHWVREVFI